MKLRVDQKGKALHNTPVLSRGWFNPFLLVFLFLRSKGRTIRKVIKEFSSRRNFFSLANSLFEFFYVIA